MKSFKEFSEAVVMIQAQDPKGNSWRTYDTSVDRPQQILMKMKKLKKSKPNFRIRAVDKDGKMVDLLTEFTTPAGTTGKRNKNHMKFGPARDMTGKIISAPIFKSASSRSGGK